MEDHVFTKEGFLRVFQKRFLIGNKPGRVYELGAGDGLVGSLGVWFEGAMSNQAEWEAKVKDLEVKVAAAETKSAEANTKIVTKVIKKLELVRTRGNDVIQYVDREVVKDKEVIKFVENCPIPQIIVNTHNAAALNQPIELKK